MDTVLLTCCYPAAEPFISDFAASLSRQSSREFELFVVNDGLHRPERFFSGTGLAVRFLPASGSPAQLRRAGIEWVAQEGARQVVFGDIDDYFADNRVEISLRLLESHPVVCNEMLLFGAGLDGLEPMIGDRFREEERITAANLEEGNCLGLTNTAADAALVAAACQSIPDDTIAFDWALFYRALCEGGDAVYTCATATFYRQYGANIANPRLLGDPEIKRGVLVKMQQYRALSQQRQVFASLARSFAALHRQLTSDEAFATNYCNATRARAPERALWWESIQLPEEWSYEIGKI